MPDFAPAAAAYSRPMPSMRTRVAAGLGRAASAASRVSGRGDGAVIGARVTLVLAPHALDELAAGWRVAAVSGTNGKSTTTAFLAAACTAGRYRVASNIEGANLRSGVVGLFSSRRTRDADLAVLEIDELALPTLLPSFARPVVVLLNLSRDQLDRFGEVRTVAAQWRRALSVNPSTVVANADDPLVVWGAGAAEEVTFVGVGLGWRLDAISCPGCGERIESTDGDWWCSGCTLRRPAGYQLDGDELRDPEGAVVAVLRPASPAGTTWPTPRSPSLLRRSWVSTRRWPPGRRSPSRPSPAGTRRFPSGVRRFVSSSPRTPPAGTSCSR